MRLDLLLVERGLFESREQAQRAVMAGIVEVDGQRVDKAGAAVAIDARLEVKGPREPFVSRAGRKLAAALDHFGVDPAGRVCLDVGASHRRLHRLPAPARRAHGSTRSTSAAASSTRRCAPIRGWSCSRAATPAISTPSDVPEPCGLMTVDVSFISLKLVVPAVRRLPRARRPTWWR